MAPKTYKDGSPKVKGFKKDGTPKGVNWYAVYAKEECDAANAGKPKGQRISCTRVDPAGYVPWLLKKGLNEVADEYRANKAAGKVGPVAAAMRKAAQPASPAPRKSRSQLPPFYLPDGSVNPDFYQASVALAQKKRVNKMATKMQQDYLDF